MTLTRVLTIPHVLWRLRRSAVRVLIAVFNVHHRALLLVLLVRVIVDVRLDFARLVFAAVVAQRSRGMRQPVLGFSEVVVVLMVAVIIVVAAD